MKKLTATLTTVAILLTFFASNAFAQQKMATKAADVKAKLQTFKDKKKAQTVEKINENLDKVNGQRTSKMMAQINKMSEILTKLGGLASQQAAITSAKAAVDNARTAVTTQSQKQYSITITSESKAKTDAKNTRDVLQTDLKAVHTLMVTARQSVANAISTTKSTLRGNNGK